MPLIHHNADTSPLTDEEIKWCKALEKLLLKTPKRFGMYTIGDANITCFDKVELAARGIELEDQSASQANLLLATIRSSEQIAGLCG